MDKAERRYACGLVARLLETHAPIDPRDLAERDACDAALVHGAALWERLREAGLHWPDEKLPRVLYECAAARGAVADAEAYAFEYYEAAKRHRGPIHDVTRAAANRVAHSLYHRGEYAKAAPIFQVILHGHEVQDGPEHPATLRNLNNVASCMRALGDAAGAVPLYWRVLEGFERVLGPEHRDTLRSVNNLAGCILGQGDAARALPLFRRALDSRERVLGKEHPDTLISVGDLAECMRALGDAAGALPLNRRALDSSERVLGKEHPATLTSLNNLATCMRALGDAAGALPLHHRELETCERVLGKEHPNTLISVNNLAGCMQAPGDAAGALSLYRRALEGCERVLGPEHPQTRTTAANLASLLANKDSSANEQPPKPEPPIWSLGPSHLSVSPSVPMMMRQLPPGSLDPKERKDHLAYAHAPHTERRRGGCRRERRPEAPDRAPVQLPASRRACCRQSRLAEHLLAQDAVDLRAVAWTFRAQPRQHLGVQADGNCRLHRLGVPAAHGRRPGGIRGLRDVVGLAQAGFHRVQTRDLGRRQRTAIRGSILRSVFAHAALPLVSLLREPRRRRPDQPTPQPRTHEGIAVVCSAPGAYSPPMSDQPITLDLLGRIVRDLQSDVRELRTRVGVLEIDVVGLKVAMAGFSERLSDLQKTVLAGFNDVGESNRRLEQLLMGLTPRPSS
jgi:tetratricopeptide (TPR) repeat protein